MATYSVNIAANTWVNLSAAITAVGKQGTIIVDRDAQVDFSAAAPAGSGTAVAANTGIDYVKTAAGTLNLWVRAPGGTAKVLVLAAGSKQVILNNT